MITAEHIADTGQDADNSSLPAPGRAEAVAARVAELGDWVPPALGQAIRSAAVTAARNAEAADRTARARTALQAAVAVGDLEAAETAATALLAAEKVESVCPAPVVDADLVDEALDRASSRLIAASRSVEPEPPLYAQLLGDWRRTGAEGVPPAALPTDLAALEAYADLRARAEECRQGISVWSDASRTGDVLSALGSAKAYAEMVVAVQVATKEYRVLCRTAVDARQAAGIPTF